MNNNYEITYGRKIVKGTQKKKYDYVKALYLSWTVCFLVGLVVGVILSLGIRFLFRDEAAETASEPIETSEPIVETVEPIVETVSESTIEITPTPEPQIISLGEYKLTAYCSCEKCCDHWATVRPLDENGKPIVYTANMSVAKQGVTVAADTSVLPFGTVLLIDDHEYIVQDRGGAIKGNRIDVYFESHEEALQFGVQYKEIFMKEGTKS